MIIDPRGEVVVRAAGGEETILAHEARRSIIRAAKTANDVAGHHARPDVFQLTVRGAPVTTLAALAPPADADE